MNYSTQHYEHSTADEKRFLNKLGNHSTILMPRVILLEKYLIALKNKVKWGLVDSYEVEAYARKLLAEEKRKYGITESI